ncbi:hypothetical protein PHJA_002621000 [Phtheirospermum japonicum]|uniref:Uncharacterized protein n=1 Tax=Phtheirospermum japonicum TaxID=374723 RepID=A0A830D0B3_9LAMI|nr:hypothetical protein PHJA_002621000 [Phtheirospermum japonicum]
MLRLAAKFPRAARNGIGPSFSLLKPPPPQPIRHYSVNNSAFTPNPVAVEMIKYATSLARDQKTEESYARGLLILEQCESTQPDDNSKGLVELARSTLLFERGSHEAAIERLGKLQDLNLSSIAIKVAASEALVGIYLEHYQEDAASAVADLALQILGSVRQEIGNGGGFEALEARIKALKGLIELISGNLDSAQSIFEGSQGDSFFVGNAALCYGEFLHGMRKFSTAKEVYTKVIKGVSEIKEFCDPNNLGACNMTSEEVAISAACALGQLEAHMGNFSDAEEILTAALKKMEERFGSHHPKVGVVLTCIALMYRLKATTERSSSLLIQEGLFRRALELLKAPPLDVEGASENVHRKDIITLARGGYAETLGVQQSRKAEAERLKSWAEAGWGNRWMSLGEALELSESSPKDELAKFGLAQPDFDRA